MFFLAVGTVMLAAYGSSYVERQAMKQQYSNLPVEQRLIDIEFEQDRK